MSPAERKHPYPASGINRRAQALVGESFGPIGKSLAPVRVSSWPVRESLCDMRKTSGHAWKTSARMRKTSGCVRKSPWGVRESSREVRNTSAAVKRASAAVQETSCRHSSFEALAKEEAAALQWEKTPRPLRSPVGNKPEIVIVNRTSLCRMSSCAARQCGIKAA
jgi:hypothetical protein